MLNRLTRFAISHVWQHALNSWKGFISILQPCMRLLKVGWFIQIRLTVPVKPAVNNRAHFSYLQKKIVAFFFLIKQQKLIPSFSELWPFSFSVVKQYNRNITYSFCLRLDVKACLLYVWCLLQLFKCIRGTLENNAIWILFYLLF